MLRNLNKSSGGRRILGTPNVGLLASQIISETATGDNGAGLLYDAALLNPGKELRLRVTSMPSAGIVSIAENGAITADFAGAPDGLYTLGYDEFVDNVFWRTDTSAFAVGAVNVSASAGTGTSTGTGSGGLATAGNSASAPGGVGTYIGIGSGGRARGSNGLAPTVFVKASGIYEQVSAVYVKQAGLYQPAVVFVKQTNSWVQL